jgi:hypothetical protein
MAQDPTTLSLDPELVQTIGREPVARAQPNVLGTDLVQTPAGPARPSGGELQFLGPVQDVLSRLNKGQEVPREELLGTNETLDNLRRELSSMPVQTLDPSQVSGVGKHLLRIRLALNPEVAVQFEARQRALRVNQIIGVANAQNQILQQLRLIGDDPFTDELRTQLARVVAEQVGDQVSDARAEEILTSVETEMGQLSPEQRGRFKARFASGFALPGQEALNQLRTEVSIAQTLTDIASEEFATPRSVELMLKPMLDSKRISQDQFDSAIETAKNAEAKRAEEQAGITDIIDQAKFNRSFQAQVNNILEANSAIIPVPTGQIDEDTGSPKTQLKRVFLISPQDAARSVLQGFQGSPQEEFANTAAEVFFFGGAVREESLEERALQSATELLKERASGE